MSKKYPKIIFVQLQGEGEDEYLQTETDIIHIPDDGKVAVYELKEIKTKKTEMTLL